MQKLTALPLIVMADDSIATLASMTNVNSEASSLYVMGPREARTLSAQSHRIVQWTVSHSYTPITSDMCKE